MDKCQQCLNYVEEDLCYGFCNQCNLLDNDQYEIWLEQQTMDFGMLENRLGKY